MSTGGSSQLKPKRDRKPRADKTTREKNATDRVKDSFGDEFVEKLQLHWSFLDTRDRDADIADGVLMGLVGLGLSENEIRSIICVGGYRIARLRERIKLGPD
jgi:hypothetical protein